MNLDTCTTSSMEFECCPECGQKLIKSKEGIFKECTNCSYKSVLHIGDINSTGFVSLESEPDKKPGGLYGWICPKCGAVMSPYEPFCPNCTKRNYDFTWTASNTIK